MITNSHQPTLNNQRGIALIASLIIMLLMTIVALSAFRGNSLFEKIAGNTREKQRALQVAQDALLAGEYWLGTQPSAPPTNTCNGALTKITVCNVSATTSPSTIDGLKMYTGLTPSSAMSTAGGGGVTSSGDIVYAQNPGIYIYYIGLNAQDNAPLYEVTAIGYGGTTGTNRTEAIVQSIYRWQVAGTSGGSGPGGGGGGGSPPSTSVCLSC